MPLFMDVHNLGDPVALNDVAHAHAADLQHQDVHDVHYLRYWVDEPDGKSSASSTPRTPRRRPPSTAKPTGSWPVRSTRCRKARDRMTHLIGCSGGSSPRARPRAVFAPGVFAAPAHAAISVTLTEER